MAKKKDKHEKQQRNLSPSKSASSNSMASGSTTRSGGAAPKYIPIQIPKQFEHFNSSKFSFDSAESSLSNDKETSVSPLRTTRESIHRGVLSY